MYNTLQAINIKPFQMKVKVQLTLNWKRFFEIDSFTFIEQNYLCVRVGGRNKKSNKKRGTYIIIGNMPWYFYDK